jgi:hypothetical protein
VGKQAANNQAAKVCASPSLSAVRLAGLITGAPDDN